LEKNDKQKERVQMINRFNHHVCEAFYADKVLLVEGDTETIVYRDLLERFYPNEEIFVLNTGSKNNIPFFQEILTKFQINHFIIHDTDEEKNKKGNKNSAWTLNKTIWDKIEDANKLKSGLARRYVLKKF
jgi:predicted ATP-dependent endonuclease of OLD family